MFTFVLEFSHQCTAWCFGELGFPYFYFSVPLFLFVCIFIFVFGFSWSAQSVQCIALLGFQFSIFCIYICIYIYICIHICISIYFPSTQSVYCFVGLPLNFPHFLYFLKFVFLFVFIFVFLSLYFTGAHNQCIALLDFHFPLFCIYIYISIYI